MALFDCGALEGQDKVRLGVLTSGVRVREARLFGSTDIEERGKLEWKSLHTLYTLVSGSLPVVMVPSSWRARIPY
jgi:hypothetical protein